MNNLGKRGKWEQGRGAWLLYLHMDNWKLRSWSTGIGVGRARGRRRGGSMRRWWMAWTAKAWFLQQKWRFFVNGVLDVCVFGLWMGFFVWYPFGIWGWSVWLELWELPAMAGLWVWIRRWRRRWRRREWLSAFAISRLRERESPSALSSLNRRWSLLRPIQKHPKRWRWVIIGEKEMKNEIELRFYLEICEGKLCFLHLCSQRNARDSKKPKDPWLFTLQNLSKSIRSCNDPNHCWVRINQSTFLSFKAKILHSF